MTPLRGTDAPTPIEDIREQLRQAEGLLTDALFMRMYGERPPGAPRGNPKAETWPDWDTRCEHFLRRNEPGAAKPSERSEEASPKETRDA